MKFWKKPKKWRVVEHNTHMDRWLLQARWSFIPMWITVALWKPTKFWSQAFTGCYSTFMASNADDALAKGRVELDQWLSNESKLRPLDV